MGRYWGARRMRVDGTQSVGGYESPSARQISFSFGRTSCIGVLSVKQRRNAHRT